MDRRTFLIGAVFSLASTLSAHAINANQQKQVDEVQDVNNATLLAGQKALTKEQLELNKALDDIPDLAPVTAMQDVLVRVLCDMTAVELQIPYQNVLKILQFAQQYVFEGGNAFSENFWNDVVEAYIKESSEPDAEIQGSIFLTRLTAL